jgi:hypothetical protein
MRSHLHARLRRLEALAEPDLSKGKGIVSLLTLGSTHGQQKERRPLATLTDAELDAEIAALAGARGLVSLLRGDYEHERARRAAAGCS